ncbi:hypothetical protein L7F22_013009 [Adiantum nelumboides]|nr:hypothetical protein [Adiantum nelumboides]
MANPQCLRSIFQTLVEAASTLALFVASNWGLAGVIGDAQTRGIPQQLAFHTHVAFAVPLVALYMSVYNALQVWSVEKSLNQEADRSRYPDRDTISIITLCPIYIQFPEPAIDQRVQLQALIEQNNYRQVDTDVHGDHMNELLEVCPLALCPATVDAMLPQAEARDGRMMCIQLPDTSPLSDGQCAPDRLVLLSLDLVPRSKELSFLPSKKWFQSLITAIQAIGYALTVLHRIIKHLGISPVEAIVTFLCIIVTIQLGIEALYANGIYQRPLLVRLNRQQFDQFRQRREQANPNRHFRRTKVKFKGMLLGAWMLAAGPSLYSAYHYLKIDMKGCATAALMFFVGETLLVILLAMIACLGVNVDSMSFPMVFFSALVYGGSLVVAFLYTFLSWDHFHRSVVHHDDDWFSWILRFFPRVST